MKLMASLALLGSALLFNSSGTCEDSAHSSAAVVTAKSATLIDASERIPGALAAGEAAKPITPLSDIDRYQYVVGTQTIGVKYGFTKDTRLEETAKAILATGSNILKISLGRKTFEKYKLPKDDSITDLVGLATREPSVQAVLAMPFAHYLFWSYPLKSGDWVNGFDDKESQREYREMYDLTRHLRSTFKGTGKSFYLGHWEGDWLLRNKTPDGDYEKQADPQRITNMIAWLNTRQKAIDDAKRATPDSDVQVWGYTEVNRVLDDLAPNHRGLTNSVLPNVNVDFVSYSSYDATSGDPAKVHKRLTKAIAHIESKLRPKPGITGRRVFIGEFGTNATDAKTPERFESLARNVLKVGLELDCPMILFWEMYCNEIDNIGKHRGFWLIDDKGRKTTLYTTFAAFQQQSHAWVLEQKRRTGHLPDREAYRKQAIAILDALPTPTVP